MFPIHALTESDLPAAQALAAALFPWEDEHQEALKAVACPSERAEFLASRGLDRVRAWVGSNADQVVGLGSLYEYRRAPDEMWLAWFGLSPEVRGRGHGNGFLEWLIALSRAEGKSVFRLWTTIEDEYAPALQLYAKRGFRPELQPALPGESWQTVVLSLSLTGGVPPPWRAHFELCGRVTSVAA